MTALYIGNDMMISFSGDGKLVDENNLPVTDATVKAYLYERGTTTPVDGVAWPVTLDNDGGGEYSCALPDTAMIVKDHRYDLKITAEVGEVNATWEDTVRATTRSFLK